MVSVQELRQLLNNLVEEWPGDENNPNVERAREYLGSSSLMSFGNYELADDQSEDYLTALWYSL
jgi:hypothetical protein